MDHVAMVLSKRVVGYKTHHDSYLPTLLRYTNKKLPKSTQAKRIRPPTRPVFDVSKGWGGRLVGVGLGRGVRVGIGKSSVRVG